MTTYEDLAEKPEALRDFLFCWMRRQIRLIICSSYPDIRIHDIDDTIKLLEIYQKVSPVHAEFYLKILRYLRSRTESKCHNVEHLWRFRPVRDRRDKPTSTLILNSYQVKPLATQAEPHATIEDDFARMTQSQSNLFS